MNVTVENLAPCKRLLRVEVEPEKVEAAFAEITGQFQREARLPGFRPGKAPKDMIAKRFENDIKNEVKRKLISDSYRTAVYEQKLTVVGQPDVEEIQFERGRPLQFAATLEIAPEFELPEYKGLPAKREAAVVKPEDVEHAIKALAERQSQFNTVARELKAGDFAVVNYKGTCEDKPISEHAPTARGLTEKTNYWIPVEAGAFIPGFAPQLIGMKAGDKRTVNVDFPADFVVPQVAGKKGVYEVELVEVKEKVTPAMDDKFASDLGAKSLEHLREGVRQDLQNELNQKQSRSIRAQVTQALLDKIQCDLPESIVEGETRDIVYSIVSENQQRGIEKQAIETHKDQIYANANATARQRVKATFAYRRIAEKEGIRVEQVEIARRLQEMAAQYKTPVDKMVKDLEKAGRLGEIYQQILSEKVVDLLVQFARVEDAAPAAT